MKAVPHKRPKYPKADLLRRFVLRVSRRGKLTIREID